MTSGGLTEFSSPQMVQLGNLFANNAEQLSASFRSVSNLPTEIRAAWRSNAVQFFDEAVTIWLRNFAKVIDALTDMADMCHASDKNYNQADETAQAAMTQLQSVLSENGVQV